MSCTWSYQKKVLRHFLFLCLPGMALAQQVPMDWPAMYLKAPPPLEPKPLQALGAVSMTDARADTGALGLFVARGWLNRPLPRRIQAQGGLQSWARRMSRQLSGNIRPGPVLHIRLLNLWLHEPGDAGLTALAGGRPSMAGTLAQWRLAAECYLQQGQDSWQLPLLDTIIRVAEVVATKHTQGFEMRYSGVPLAQIRRWPRFAGQWLASFWQQYIADCDALVAAGLAQLPLRTEPPLAAPPVAPEPGPDGVYCQVQQLVAGAPSPLAFKLETDRRFRLLYSQPASGRPFMLDRQPIGCRLQNQLYWRLGNDSFEPMYWHHGHYYGMGPLPAELRRMPQHQRFEQRFEQRPYRLDLFWKMLLD